MNYEELSVILRETAKLIQGDRLTEIDFAALTHNLVAAAESLLLAQQDHMAAGRVLDHFRDELRRRARATAQLTGGDCGLIEKLIDSAEATFDDLVKLSKQLTVDFDRAFSTSITGSQPGASGDGKFSAYKS